MRFEVRVKPNSRGSWVGGTWGDGRVLNVHVADRAVSGQANRAVVEILASALRVRRRQVSIVQGQKSQTKLIEVAEPPPGTEERLEHWLAK